MNKSRCAFVCEFVYDSDSIIRANKQINCIGTANSLERHFVLRRLHSSILHGVAVAAVHCCKQIFLRFPLVDLPFVEQTSFLCNSFYDQMQMHYPTSANSNYYIWPTEKKCERLRDD